jgi:hypothetical protein
MWEPPQISRCQNGECSNTEDSEVCAPIEICTPMDYMCWGGDACYYLVQNIVTSLISKNAKSNTYRTIILPAVLYGVIFGLVGYRRLCLINDYSTPTVTEFILTVWLYSECCSR